MTNEERQRTMDFILQQMAQFAASIQRSEKLCPPRRVVVMTAPQF